MRGQTPGSGARDAKGDRMLSWRGLLVKLLAVAALIAAIAGEGDGWTW